MKYTYGCSRHTYLNLYNNNLGYSGKNDEMSDFNFFIKIEMGSENLISSPS